MKIKQLDLATYSEKAQNFARTIEKHYPFSTTQGNPQYKPYMHMHDHRKEREIFDRPTSEKLQCMRTFKTEGNSYFKQQKHDQAAQYYHRIIIFADYTFPETQLQQNQMETLVQAANMNLALCLVKLNQWEGMQGQISSVQILLRQAIKGPESKIQKKGRYWTVKYWLKKGELSKAQQSLIQFENCLKQNQEIASEDRKLLQELKELVKSQEKDATKQAKGIFGNIFGKK